MSAIAVIGAGPTGTCLVERICANAPELVGDSVLDIHVVDPHPHGAGRVWRTDQPDLLWANSAAADITIHTDGSVRCEGPIQQGPSLAEWLGCDPGFFAPRPVLSRYLSHAFERAVRTAPRNVRVHAHRAVALDVADLRAGQRLELSDGRWLEVDAMVLAQGHQSVLPSSQEVEQAAFAARRGLAYLPTGYAADLDLDVVPAGKPVLMRGAGLAFIDLMVLLTSGRGGRFTSGADGSLTYLPSGAEPLLHVGSRRGVPYHGKTGYRLSGSPAALPKFFGSDGAERRPLVAKELAYAYYHELFHAHPSRTRLDWAEFEAAFTEAGWGGKEMRALITKAVPRFADRLHLERIEQPLRGIRFGDLAGLQRWMHGYIAADLGRRADPAHSADLAMIHGLLSVHAVLAEAPSDPWFQRLFNFLASGPPARRLAELRALARAGVVTFLGADPRIEQDERAGTWRATSATVPGAVEARALVEARLPPPSVSRSTDPIISALYARGECREAAGLLDVRLPDRRLLGQGGAAHPRRFALGPWVVGGRGTAGFARPGVNAPLFRHADALARSVLGQTAGARLRAAA
ncbi:FAD/NAD(P)-binding domain-containing protein [Nonomuraea sp. NEAU-A123]|uniref:FAD/NAD(P)-binding protein n=1 Tax=Nonomuraea sp. NEAU-A123 TaxID=2839649 RepID=UPI001BE4BBD8|nr:FAD/NAD(P)-binding protein [Nonomuraea sp. NEAU-A123]MBT2231601.1 FAD/NAD(P)-binding protein [Nonomuraea sp. NEAU-A123]